MSWKPKTHLPGRDLDHASLCNVKARRWSGKKLVKVDVSVTADVEAFKKLTFAEQCGRCFLALCAREGTPVMRQR